VDRGTAGSSAQAQFDRRHRREQERLDERWGRLSGVAKLLHEDKQSTKAWSKGAEGERRVAGFLERTVGDGGVVLNDRCKS
jgi:hypothetical protein